MEDTGQQEWKKTKSATWAREGTTQQNTRAVCPRFHQAQQAGKEAGQKRKDESLKPNNWKKSLMGFQGGGGLSREFGKPKTFLWVSLEADRERKPWRCQAVAPKPDSLTHRMQKDGSDSPLPPLLWVSPVSKGDSEQRRGWLPTLRSGDGLCPEQPLPLLSASTLRR